MSRTLEKVRRENERRREVCATADARYIGAIRAARQAGHTLEEIGKTVGTSKQAVWNLLNYRKERP